jgi:hypothetical protein
MKTKKCSKCKEVKCIKNFSADKKSKDGLRYWCRVCMAKNNKEWRSKNPDRERENRIKWVEANPEKILAAQRRWNNKHPQKRLMFSRRWRSRNPERVRELRRRWDENNPIKVKESSDKQNIKRKNDPKTRLSSSMRAGIYHSILKGTKAGSKWELLVNYTVDQLKKHLEKLFTSEMTWDNYGTVWEIDHKIPIVAFNFETPRDIDFKRCWALSNLQPLISSENRSKRSKLVSPFQPSLCIKV